MSVWFTADTHFGHANIIKYCKRPFLTAEERKRADEDLRGKWRISDESVRRHDEALLDAINARVGEKDDLWILGDFCWGRREVAVNYRSRIRCENVFLVWGNHDHRSIAPLFRDTLEQGMLTIEDQPIWLCHYPSRSWDRRFHGSWHLYGHVHGRLSQEDAAHPTTLTRDIGVDACDYRPWSFEEVGEFMAPRMAAFQARKEAIQRGERVDDIV